MAGLDWIDYQSAMDSWTKAVPDELRRAFYMRIYKWVVAFATWRSIDHTAVAVATTSAKSASKAKDASSAAAAATGATLTSTIITSSSSSNRAVVSPPSSRHTGRSDKLSIGPSPSSSLHPHHHHSPSPGAAYTTRQARSQVVAHEALKKGKKVSTMCYSVVQCIAEFI